MLTDNQKRARGAPRRMKNDLPRANLWLATMPMLIAGGALIALAAASLHALSGIRAYVGGEGLWSKAQEDAIYYLVRYARTADASDFQKYQTAILVPLGDRKAREALDRPVSAIDYETARRGFLEGRNNAADIPTMSAIFVHLRNLSYIANAISRSRWCFRCALPTASFEHSLRASCR